MTAALIELETGDFAYAARVLVGEAADPAAAAMRSTWSVLGDCAGMAGNDPGGAEWGSAYDGAATAAADATVAGVQAVEQVARMFGQTAGNYLAADAASMPYPRLRPVLALPPVPAFALSSCRPPSAIGAAGGGPPGWGLIADAVGYVWPNGHQDRLRRAGAAWQRSSAVLAAAASSVLRAPQSAALHGLPEYADVLATCSGLAEHLREVSHVHARLAAACAELADHLDRVHGEVTGELRSLVEWTAGIEGASAVLSVFTLGAAEIPGQAAEAARVARTAAVVGRCIERFLTAASSLASDVASVVDRAGAVGARLRALVELPLLEPALAGVGPLRVLNEAREVQAVARLEQAAAVPARAELGDFVAPRIYRDRHGQLTNGRYTVVERDLAVHTGGAPASFKSQFFFHVDAHRAVLDAAAYADRYGLWVGNKAKVYVTNGSVGVWAKTGEPTRWINLYRSNSGALHGAPGGAP